MANFNDLKARFQNGDNPLETDFSALIDAIAEAGAREPSLNVYASDIRNMMAANSLKKGALYRIPFQTKHVISNTTVVNTGATEYLLLYALTSSTVSRFVYSESYPQDVIALDLSNVICEDGTTSREGKITYRKDYDRNLETWYDFRNVRFRRWQVDTASNASLAWQASHAYAVGDGVLFNSLFYRCVKSHTSGVTFTSDNWQIIFVTDTNNKWACNTTLSMMGVSINANLSVYEDYLTFNDSSSKDISIGRMNDGSYNNVVVLHSYGNSIGEDSKNITFAYGSYGNIIGNKSSDILLFNSAYSNIIGDSCNNVVVCNSACYNSIKSNVNNVFLVYSATSNCIESGAYNSTLASVANCTLHGGSYGNKIEYSSDNSEIGSDSFGNNIGYSSKNVKIGSNCSYNSVVHNSQSCEIGDNSSNNNFHTSPYNNLGMQCSDNSFLADSQHNTLEGDCTNVSFDQSSRNVVKECNNSTFERSSYNKVKGAALSLTDSSSNEFSGTMSGIENGSYNYLSGISNSVISGLNNHIGGGSYISINGNGNIIEYNCFNISMPENNNYNKIGTGCTMITFDNGASHNEVSSGCYNIKFETDLPENTCNYNYVGKENLYNIIRGNHIVLSTGCSGNEFAFGTSCIHFGVCVSNVKFLDPQNDLRFEVSGDIDKVFDGTYPNATVSKVSPDGSLWYETIDNAGVVTLHKLTEYVEEPEEPEPTGPTLLQTIKIDLGTSATTTDTTWNYVTTNYTSGSPFALNNIAGASSGCVVFPVSFAINGVTGASPDSGTGYSIPTDIMKSYFYVSSPNARNLTFKGDPTKVYDIIIYGSRATSGSTAPKGTIYTIGGVAKNLECYGNTNTTVSFDKVVPDGTGQIVINVAADTTGGNTTGYINAVIVKEYAV
ncbi:hypothetical protein [Sporocytophaga myxococcoides]|uniref:hypothetical protein n=1 Tax=Sporocytophaga myxococcoides TaxID=153721 RepID=UPI000427DC44|nr:hypothetical protein [Sporocytophaga myxococcoides]